MYAAPIPARVQWLARQAQLTLNKPDLLARRSPVVQGWPLVLALAALALYLATRSLSLDDFDSGSFVLALDRFDPVLQQPQPPGFPVYVALGRLVHAVVPDPVAALTLLSAIGGAAAVGLVAVLGWMLTHRADVGLAAGVIFALSPIQWLTAGKALSDVPGLALSLAALAVLWAARTRPRWLIPGAALLGLSLGTRLQANLPGLLLLAWLLWDARRARRWSAIGLALIVLGMAVALWLIPIAQAAGGLDVYRDLIDAHSEHVWESDSLFGAEPLSATTLRARAKDFLDTFLVPTLGLSLYEPLTLAGWAQIAALIGFIVGGLALADYRRAETRALVVWLLVVIVPLFLLESLNRPRLMLPALPPLILLVIGGWARLPGRIAPLRWAIWGIAALGLLLEGAPLADTLHRVEAPPTQAAAAIRAQYPPDQTLVAAAGSFRTAQIELSEYQLVYLYRFDAAAVADLIAGGDYRYIAVLDREQFAGVMDVLDAGGRYVPVIDRTFSRDPRVHWQHSQVRLQVLTPADQLQPDDLRLPPAGRIDLGGDDGRYLGRGWFRPESVGGVSARWAEALSVVRVTLDPGAYRVTLRAAAYPAGQAITVRVNGEIVAEIDLAQDWADHSFTLDVGNGITTLELEHARSESPYTRTQGGSSDQRRLAAAYDWIQFEPVGE